MVEIPILVCSPFAAMQRERDILHKIVFPQLGSLTREHGADLRVVDLLWGIPGSPDVTDEFLEIIASELNRTSILIALLNGRAVFPEERLEQVIRSLQIYVALMSKTCR